MSFKRLIYGAINSNFLSSCFDESLFIGPPCNNKEITYLNTASTGNGTQMDTALPVLLLPPPFLYSNWANYGNGYKLKSSFVRINCLNLFLIYRPKQTLFTIYSSNIVLFSTRFTALRLSFLLTTSFFLLPTVVNNIKTIQL